MLPRGWVVTPDSSGWPGFASTSMMQRRQVSTSGNWAARMLIPPESLDSDFRAKAEFSQWLAHPNELGRPPDLLEIVDRRDLAWPPDFERKTLWLIKYRLRGASGAINDDVGVGLVGSVTFSLPGAKLEQRIA